MTQVLIYENVTPVSSGRHKDLSIESVDFEFASKVSSVPLTAVEIPIACREYPIVFAGDDKLVAPMVILGVEGNSNLYLDENMSWKADYIPAFIRRYPFVFSSSEDGKQFTLCVDNEWSGCNTDGKGQRLFSDDGEQTPYTENMLNFLKDYQQQFATTKLFCDKLQELDLLEAMQANMTLPNGEKHTLQGFFSVSRNKLHALEPSVLAELAKSNFLELIYLQMTSMNNLQYIINRFVPKKPEDVDQEEPTGS